MAAISMIAVACGLAPSAAAQTQPVPRQGPLSGRVIAAKGGEQARLVPAPQWQRALSGQDIRQGDLVRTNPTGTLALLFADRTQVRLGPNSTMAINAVAAGAPSQVTLNAGKAWGRSPRMQTNLQVRTPSATAAIRGTEWAISATDDDTLLEVFSGEVELANDLGSVTVNSGEAARARRGQAPVKVQITNPEGREQMLYFVRAEDALAMMQVADPRFAEARALVYAGNWDAAAARFAEVQQAADPATRAAGAYGAYVAAVQMGQPPVPPGEENEPNAILGRTLIAAYGGRLREALTIVDAGLAHFPDAIGLYRAKARVAMLLGQPDVARDAIDTGPARFPGNADLLGLRAEYLTDYAGSPKAAVKLARAAVALKPEDPDLQATLARIWLALGGLTEARTAADRALAARPQDAALFALRADILLAQNEGGAARASLDRALALEPDLSIVRLGLAEEYYRKGQRRAALDEALAASAANPSFGRGFVKLAELSYDDAKPGVAIQQLDAADRLDPHGPAIPLARTAIALHRFDADGAIEGARDALARQRGRGGEYSNLSENQQSGSLVSQSFRFLNLEGWGRYYADRAFDSFSPVSYPDQVLNRTPSPFLIRGLGGTFDAFNGLDADYISSFLQGAVLAPLSVVNAKHDLLFSRRNFFEASAGGSYLTESERSLYTGDGSISGIVNGAVPIGYNLTLSGIRARDSLPQVDTDIAIDRRRQDEHHFQAMVGFELTPRDKFVTIARDDLARDSSTFDNDLYLALNQAPGRVVAQDIRRHDTSGAVFWNHEFGYRNAITIGGLYSRIGVGFLQNLPSIEDTVRLSSRQQVDHLLLSANYARSIGAVDMRGGVEYSRYDFRSRSLFQGTTISGFINVADCPLQPDLCDSLGFDGQYFNIPINLTDRYDDIRPYLDMRAEIGSWLILQGQVSHIWRKHDQTDQVDPTNSFSDRSQDLNYQVGAAIEPVTGQWLRGAVIRRTSTGQDFTFAPIAAVGLRGTLAPSVENSRVTSYVGRWDAEWLPHFFTSLDYQHQDFTELAYKVPSTDINISGGKARLDRYAAEANLWLRGNIGVRVAYARTDARAGSDYISATRDPLSSYGAFYAAGDRLPYVPRDTGQVALTLTGAAPFRRKVELSVDYLGNQIGGSGEALPGYAVVNLRAEAEPFQRRLRLEAALLNLFDKRFIEGPGIAGPGITGRVAATVRF